MSETQHKVDEPIEAAHSLSTDDAVMAVRFQASVEFVLNRLEDMELAQLHMSITWNDGDMKSRCKDRPWFEKVSHLFTQDDGKNMHSATVEAIGRAANKRLTQ